MDLFNKAKEFLDTVESKAGEFVYDQKNNIKIAKVCSALKWNYEKLGRLCYRKCKNIAIDDNEFDAIITRIEVLKEELNCLRDGDIEYSSDCYVFEDGELVSEETKDEQ